MVVIDLRGEEAVAELGDRARSSRPTSPIPMRSPRRSTPPRNGPLRINVNCAGIGNAIKTLGKDGPFSARRVQEGSSRST